MDVSYVKDGETLRDVACLVVLKLKGGAPTVAVMVVSTPDFPKYGKKRGAAALMLS